jgi:hypothetical protein
MFRRLPTANPLTKQNRVWHNSLRPPDHATYQTLQQSLQGVGILKIAKLIGFCVCYIFLWLIFTYLQLEYSPIHRLIFKFNTSNDADWAMDVPLRVSMTQISFSTSVYS